LGAGARVILGKAIGETDLCARHVSEEMHRSQTTPSAEVGFCAQDGAPGIGGWFSTGAFWKDRGGFFEREKKKKKKGHDPQVQKTRGGGVNTRTTRGEQKNP